MWVSDYELGKLADHLILRFPWEIKRGRNFKRFRWSANVGPVRCRHLMRGHAIVAAINVEGGRLDYAASTSLPLFSVDWVRLMVRDESRALFVGFSEGLYRPICG